MQTNHGRSQTKALRYVCPQNPQRFHEENPLSTLQEQLVPALCHRGCVYQITRNMAANAPSPELLSALTKTVQEDNMSNVHMQGLANELDLAMNDATYAQAIHEDYARLFIGPHIPAPLWESVLRDEEHLLFGKDTLDVRHFYQNIGLVFPQNASEPDDHLALELECMWVLNASLLGAIQNPEQDLAVIQASCRLQQQFLAEHVLQWVPQTCKILEEAAQTAFYRLFARLLSSFLPLDYQFVQELVTQTAKIPQRKEFVYA